MDTDRLAALLHSINRRAPRRAALALLGGGLATLPARLGADDVQARSGCRKSQRRCGKRCIPRHACCGDAECPGRRCCKGSCTECCADKQCGAGNICAGGVCVVGRGTCPAGADSCTDEIQVSCGAGCVCNRSVTGETRCGRAAGQTVCCSKDSQCAALGAGAFCRNGQGDCAGCPEGRACLLPCQA